MNEPRIWPNSPEEEHRLRQDIAARATQDSSEPDAAKELVKAIRRARHDGVKLVAAHDAALIAKTLAERQAAESPGPETPTEHTPLPWRVRQHPNDPDEFHISAATPKGHPYHGSTKEIEIMSDEDYPTKRADAELIVRAVNGLAERSLAEVSADEIVEAVLIAVANIPINPALRGDLVYVKDVYAAIRALKGTFSLRASGTPLIERLVTALGSAARR
jgi:hypothetical protein